MLKIRENTGAVFLAGFHDNLQPVSIPSAMKKNGRAWKECSATLITKKSTAIMLILLGK